MKTNSTAARDERSRRQITCTINAYFTVNALHDQLTRHIAPLGVLVTRMGVSDQARTVSHSLDALKETTLAGSTILVHHALGKVVL